jgi:hypothetical protein
MTRFLGTLASLLAAVAVAAPAAGSAPAATPAWATAAVAELATLKVHAAAGMASYDRDAFGTPWQDVDHNGCSTRDDILRRDLTREVVAPGCVVKRGLLQDPYTGRRIRFVRGARTSSKVQIDHVVALAAAWRTGASRWSEARRTRYANDPLVLLAVDGPQNMQKSDGDAADWLPADGRFACAYVARQIAIKADYRLWVTQAERGAMTRTLGSCGARPKRLAFRRVP